jgi:predicted DNA-binding protein (MmcQ/YjbR family)
MVAVDTFRQMALSFESAIEQPHFKATSFRINEKIFASLEEDIQRACLKFSREDQAYFCLNSSGIYAVDNYWGKSGWTYIDIAKVSEERIYEALQCAYKEVYKKKK